VKARPFRAGLAGVLVLCAGAGAASELKISHQFPAKDTDFRHKAATVIAEELGKAEAGLTGKVHPQSRC
jgi:TRAP-type C4-dicarboxylate transport system substrate-binding protein